MGIIPRPTLMSSISSISLLALMADENSTARSMHNKMPRIFANVTKDLLRQLQRQSNFATATLPVLMIMGLFVWTKPTGRHMEKFPEPIKRVLLIPKHAKMSAEVTVLPVKK